MTITTETADSLLKSYYIDTISDQLDKSVNPFLAQIEKTTRDVWGKDVKKIVRYGINGGVSAGAEGGNTPVSGGSNYSVLTAPLKNLYGTLEISDKAIRASSTNEGAFINLLNEEVGNLIGAARFNMGRMLFGDGTGKLGTASPLSSEGCVLTLDTVKYVEVGMVVDLYNRTSGLPIKQAAKIVDVDKETKKVTIEGYTVPSGYTLDLYAQYSKNQELTGLGALFGSSSTLYGLSRSANSWLKPYKKEVTTLTENDLQTAIDEIESRSGSKTNFIICSWGVRRALIDVLSQYRQSNTVQLEGGFTAITFNGIPVVADRFCPEGTMYLLNTDDFALHQLCDWEFMQNEDGSILRQLNARTIYVATLVKYCELICSRPCGQGMLYGITEK